MKNIKFLLFILLSLAIFLPNFVQAEEISNFGGEIIINKDGSVVVEEIIDYNFGADSKHGIYRDIPYKYQARGGNYTLDISVIEVKDEAGNNYKYETSKSGNNFRIKIGKAEEYVSGLKTYVLRYRVYGAINYFDDHDELYWNVTGNEWSVPIAGKMSAIIRLPEYKWQSPNIELSPACYVGLMGDQSADGCQGRVIADKNGRGISYTAQGLSVVGRGMTVVLGWPKGIVKEPTWQDKVWRLIKDNLIILLPILVFVGLYLYWRKNGRDPDGRGTVIPEYEPPVGMLPAEGGVVYDEKMDNKDMAATIIDLARRGYLKIKEEEKKVLGISAGKEWQLIKIKEKENELVGYEAELFKELLGVRNEVSLSQLKGDYRRGKNIKLIKDKVYENVTQKGWFVKNPEIARAKFIAIGTGIILFVLLFDSLASYIVQGIVGIVSLVIVAILFIIFSRWMPQKTSEGALIKEKLLGFKMFLSVTEKDRVKFHFSPAAHPEKFAEYLPWAIIFGVENEWAEVFKGIDLPAPDWYEGNWVGFYTANALSNSLNSFNKSFNSAVVGATAAKGGSGLGGGGFSGGGFGGGGGGSW